MYLIDSSSPLLPGARPSNWSDRLFAAEKFLDRHRDVAAVALRVNFLTQLRPSLFVEVPVLRFFKDGGHVGGDRVGPGVAVVTGVVAVHVAEISDEGCARI